MAGILDQSSVSGKAPAAEYAHQSWPAWFFGPDGQQQVFQSEDEVPSGWADHPSKVAGGSKAASGSTISDDDSRVDELMEYTQPELVDILDTYNELKTTEEPVEFSKSWPKLKLSKVILENSVPYDKKGE